jgi:hypothetical protein
MAYQVSGMEDTKQWVVRTDDKAAADHIAKIFVEKGYKDVATEEVTDRKMSWQSKPAG